MPPTVSPSPEIAAKVEAFRVLAFAVIALGPAFGLWEMNEQQYTAVLGVFAAVSIALTFLVRQQVTPNVSVALTTQEAALIEAGKSEVQNEMRRPGAVGGAIAPVIPPVGAPPYDEQP